MRRAALGTALVLVACSGNDPLIIDVDASHDAGMSRDGGFEVEDAGAPRDAGLPRDAGFAEEDAGTVRDGGVPRDGGERDGGPLTCEVSATEGECVDVLACGAAAFRGVCSGGLRNTCCIDVKDTCSVDGAPGVCIDTAACSFTSTPGRCPGPANVQCCTDPSLACDPSVHRTPNVGLGEEDFDASCPAGMIRVGAFCIDRYEASLVEIDSRGAVLGPWSPYHNPGSARVLARSVAFAVPQGYIDQVRAGQACANAGKRLCTNTEWLAACRGAASRTYPYGNTRVDGRCNDARARHPAIEFFGSSEPWVFNMIDNACINQIPQSVALTGAHPDCVTEDGALDMMGNLHEWTSDPSGTFRGGFYTDTFRNGEGCLYVTTAHNVGHWDYSTGFRCCAD